MSAGHFKTLSKHKKCEVRMRRRRRRRDNTISNSHPSERVNLIQSTCTVFKFKRYVQNVHKG